MFLPGAAYSDPFAFCHCMIHYVYGHESEAKIRVQPLEIRMYKKTFTPATKFCCLYVCIYVHRYVFVCVYVRSIILSLCARTYKKSNVIFSELYIMLCGNFLSLFNWIFLQCYLPTIWLKNCCCRRLDIFIQVDENVCLESIFGWIVFLKFNFGTYFFKN